MGGVLLQYAEGGQPPAQAPTGPQTTICLPVTWPVESSPAKSGSDTFGPYTSGAFKDMSDQVRATTKASKLLLAFVVSAADISIKQSGSI